MTSLVLPLNSVFDPIEQRTDRTVLRYRPNESAVLVTGAREELASTRAEL
jgi:hypothetical protein